MGDYQKLDVWKLARVLAGTAYRLTAQFPPDERFGLTSQIRRAAVSIMSNLAEGCGRNRDSELARFTWIALGSATELESHLILATDLGFVTSDLLNPLRTEVAILRLKLPRLARRLEATKKRPSGQV
jgi:four helix bundle protein